MKSKQTLEMRGVCEIESGNENASLVKSAGTGRVGLALALALVLAGLQVRLSART